MNTNPTFFKSQFMKTLSAVEAHPERSNQHEFNGVQGLKILFGMDTCRYDAVFSREGKWGQCVATVTWYDARESHPTRSEHRLYFQSNSVMDLAEAGDNIKVGFDHNNILHCVLIKSDNSQHGGKLEKWKSV